MFQTKGEKENKLFINVKPRIKGSYNLTNEDAKLEKKLIFSTGILCDQVSQYPKGYNLWKDFIMKYDFEDSNNGFMFDIVITPPSDYDSPEARSVELFNPIIFRKKPNVDEISPYQVLHQREETIRQDSKKDKWVNYKKL